MKQQTDPLRESGPATSGKKRVSTRDLVRIGQRWQRRSRQKVKPEPVVVYQVHRGQENTAYVCPEGVDPRKGSNLQRVPLSELRHKYVLLEEEQ